MLLLSDGWMRTERCEQLAHGGLRGGPGARPDHGERRDQSRRLTGREHDRGQLGPAVDRVAAARAPPDTNRHPSRLQLGRVALYGADAYAKSLCKDLSRQLAGCPYPELLDQCVEAFHPGG